MKDKQSKNRYSRQADMGMSNNLGEHGMNFIGSASWTAERERMVPTPMFRHFVPARSALERSSKIISLLVLFAVLVHSQQDTFPSDWGTVEQIPAGTQLIVHLTSGERQKGNIVRVLPDSITIAQRERTVDLARADITRILRRDVGSRKKSTGIGAAAGAAIGTGVGAYLYSKGDFETSVVPAFGLVGAGIGALIGLFARGSKTTLVYAIYPNTRPAKSDPERN